MIETKTILKFFSTPKIMSFKKNFSQKNILIVDDSPDNLLIVQTILDSLGYQNAIADSGASALVYLEQERPDLIISDVMMPDMDGWELLGRIRNNRQLLYIPILFMTCDSQINLRQVREAGGNELMHKPFEIEELILKVKNLLTNNNNSGSKPSNLLARTLSVEITNNDVYDLKQPELERIIDKNYS